MKKSDNIITNALKFHADAIEASPVMKEKIDLAISEQENDVFKNERGRVTPMKWNFKKVAVAALGVCLLTGGACYAAGQVATQYITVGGVESYCTNFGDLSSLEEEAGIKINAVETFANGYTFDSADLDKTAAVGEDDSQLYEFPEIGLRYKNGDLPSISIYAEDVAYYSGSEVVPDIVRECDGIELRYVTIINKFAPADYEWSDEDIANMDNPKYNFAEGASELTILQSQNVSWEKDGVHYHMIGFDLSISAEEMLDMAEEMVRAQ